LADEETTARRGTGRMNQKHRTRNALMDAATTLMRQGRVPSIEEVADAARVSRATAYRYFPTREHLFAGSAVLRANLDGEARLAALLTTDDPASRLDAVVSAFHERFTANEPAYRALLGVMLPRTAEAGAGQGHVRASRQVRWLDEALAPLRPRLGAERTDQLVAALIAATGFEAYTALRDISLLDPAACGDIMRWSAQALLAAALDEGRAGQ
jgi:AcrR family transcriptional regulator